MTKRHSLFQFASIFMLFAVLPAHAQEEGKKPVPDPCKLTCYNYRQFVTLEREEAREQGCPNYLSPLDDPIVARVRLAPELRDGLAAAVDDRIWLVINGVEVWAKDYPSADGTEAAFKKDKLAGGCNPLGLNWKNTQPPDAHFMAQLGGRAFCGNDAFCKTWKEGFSFGTGIIFNLLKENKTEFQSAHIWKSRIEAPPKECGCKDP
jgi:hypothetical protein